MSSGPRVHHFWDCRVAQGLRDSMSEVLEGWGGFEAAGFTRRHLWLVEAPPSVHQSVWNIVCLAALSALEHGRQLLYAARTDSGCAPSGAVTRIVVAAVADFWARLRSFASLGLPPRRWQEVPAGHLFLSSSPVGRVIVQELPDAASPPASPRSVG